MVALGGAADAAIVSTATQTLTFGSALTDFDMTKSFDLFNTSLGTLLSVSIKDTYQANSTLSVQNLGSGDSFGTVQTSSDLTLTAANAAQNNAIIQLLAGGDDDGPTTTIFTKSKNYTLASGASQSGIVSNSTTYNSDFQSASDAATLSAFAAPSGGTGSIRATTLTRSLLGNTGGNTVSSQVTTATGTFSIFYTYDNSTAIAAVPEAATWAMMLVGFGGMGAALRRRRMAQTNFG